jgi:hypothetical protein
MLGHDIFSNELVPVYFVKLQPETMLIPQATSEAVF